MIKHDIEQSEVDYASYSTWRDRNPEKGNREAYFEGLARGAERYKRAVMGFGNVSVGDCHNPDNGLHGIIYLAMSESRKIGTDTGDIFPAGTPAPAEKILACVMFKDRAAVEQTLNVLLDLRSDYFPSKEPS